MTLNALLATLEQKGVQLWAEGEKLRYRAPAGALDAGLLAALKQHKGAIMERLSGPVPVSFAQQRMWYLDRLVPNSPLYNEASSYRLKGPLDTDALIGAVHGIVARHESLRTTFSLAEPLPIQVVHTDLELDIPIEEIEEIGEEQLEQRTKEEASRPFDLAEGPLVRCRIFRLAQDDHVLLFVTHHIVYDGVSGGILQRELASLYAGEPLPAPAIRYADYAARQRQRVESAAMAGQLAFWRERLGGRSLVLQLHADHPRPAVFSYRGARKSFVLNAELAASLRRLARKEGATLFMVLLAAFKTLLFRYSGQEEICVGSPIAGRNDVDTEELIGCFINTLVLVSDLEPSMSFRDLLAAVRKTCFDAYANQDIPFERIVEELQPDRDTSRTPLFQALFAFQDISRRPATIADLAVDSSITLDTGTAKTDLTLQIEDTGEHLQGRIEYATDLFEADTIGRLFRHFEILLESIAADPERAVDRLPLMKNDERQQVLEGESWDGAPPRETIVDRFEARVARAPDAVALTCDGASLTYAELNRLANRAAHALRARGVQPETMVGLCIERSLDMVVGILAILKAGGAYVPLDPVYPRERLAFMIEDTKAPVVVAHNETLALLPQGAFETVCVDDPALESEDHANPDNGLSPDNLAYVIFTSGSTGRPKGVLVTHANVVRLFDTTDSWFSFGQDDVWTLFHSSSFDFSVWEIWGALLYGGRLVVVPYFVSRSPENFCELLRREKVTVLNQTPSAFLELIRTDTDGLALRTVIFGGEALDLESLRPWFDRHGDESPRLVNMYGITETTVHVTYRPISLEDLDARTGSVIGRPIPDLQLCILDRHLEPVPFGIPGEIHVGGAGVARGYLDREALTAERFIENRFGPGRLYRTGDLARFLPDRDVEYLGRIDDQVKLRGFRIELGEIETSLSEHPGISQAIVLKRDEQLVAWVVGSAAPDELRTHTRQHLPVYMVPSAFVVLDELPLTPNGKIDRKALPAPDTQRRELKGELVEADTSLEKDLAGIWKSALGIERVGVEDNFFDLGGHSLLMVAVQTALQEHLGRPVSIVDLFRFPTVRSLASFLQGEERLDDTKKVDDRVKKQKAARARRRRARDV